MDRVAEDRGDERAEEHGHAAPGLGIHATRMDRRLSPVEGIVRACRVLDVVTGRRASRAQSARSRSWIGSIR
jgi:hypothetical protein